MNALFLPFIVGINVSAAVDIENRAIFDES